MGSTANQFGQSAKSIAQQVARQAANEPGEILKDVKEQTSANTSIPSGYSGEVRSEDQKNTSQEQARLNDRLKSGRRMEAFNRELDDIRKQKIFADLQKRISAGEEISLEEYPELSVEQKQVLLAQMEAVKKQIALQKLGHENEIPGPAPKKGRQLFNFGKKQSMKDEQTRVEKPVPPSG